MARTELAKRSKRNINFDPQGLVIRVAGLSRVCCPYLFVDRARVARHSPAAVPHNAAVDPCPTCLLRSAHGILGNDTTKTVKMK